MSTFDPSSGLVYTESTSALVRSMVPTWMDHSTGRRINPLSYRNRGEGSSSLQKMVLRQCIWNIDSFEPEALQYLDWYYARPIYDSLKKNNTLTFNTWNLFRLAFPGQIDHLHHFQIPKDLFSPVGNYMRASVGPPSQLPSVVNRLAKFDTTPLTYLWLQGYRITISDLMSIIQIPTLAVLALHHPPLVDSESGLSERDLQDWGRAVDETSAFKKLKVLTLRGFGLPKEAILRAVSKFPALTLIGISKDFSTPETRRESYGDWRIFSEPPLKPDNMVPEDSPRAAYENRRIPISGKMDILHSLSEHSQRQSPARSVADLAVSIGHIGWDLNMVGDFPIWYFRDTEEKVVSATKRPYSTITSSQASQIDAPKKRVMRQTKQKDVGSFLNSFL